MEHSFDINIATKYGIHTAILLKNLHFWIEKNRANEKHFHDGRYWTYNSKKAFSELFPYLTERQVKYTLEKMKKDDLILVGNYNQDSYDKTNWYTLTDKALKLLGYTEKMAEKPETIERTKLSNRMDKSAPIDWTKLSNGADNIVQPIPDNKPDNKHKKVSKEVESKEKNKTSSTRKSYDEIIDEYTDNEELKLELKAFLQVIRLKNMTLTNRALILLLDDLDNLAAEDYHKIRIIQKALVNGRTSFEALSEDEEESLFRMHKWEQKYGKDFLKNALGSD